MTKVFKKIVFETSPLFILENSVKESKGKKIISPDEALRKEAERRNKNGRR